MKSWCDLERKREEQRGESRRRRRWWKRRGRKSETFCIAFTDLPRSNVEITLFMHTISLVTLATVSLWQTLFILQRSNLSFPSHNLVCITFFLLHLLLLCLVFVGVGKPLSALSVQFTPWKPFENCIDVNSN